MKENSKNNLTHTAYLAKEYYIKLPSSKEAAPFSIVRNGDTSRTSELMDAIRISIALPLSQDSIRSMQYHFVAFLTLIAQNAIEGGLQHKDSLALCNHYIQIMDSCKEADDIFALFGQAVEEFTGKVHEINNSCPYSKPILQAMDYIYDNLHKNITVNDVAAHVKLSPSYFSALFKKECEECVAAYIRRLRVEAAKKMLAHSEYSYLEISNYLSFSSQSHFISIFKKQVGITPKEYRKSCFHEI